MTQPSGIAKQQRTKAIQASARQRTSSATDRTITKKKQLSNAKGFEQMGPLTRPENSVIPSALKRKGTDHHHAL